LFKNISFVQINMFLLEKGFLLINFLSKNTFRISVVYFEDFICNFLYLLGNGL
jgi:hypothetical protein